jgi:hypothetical protein
MCWSAHCAAAAVRVQAESSARLGSIVPFDYSNARLLELTTRRLNFIGRCPGARIWMSIAKSLGNRVICELN